MNRGEQGADWRLLFELQWWNGSERIQRFHVYAVGARIVWDQAWPLFDLQQAYKRLLHATRRGCR